jgi:hypothetical protein
MKKLVLVLVMLFAVSMVGSYATAQGIVEETAPQFPGYEKAGQYWVQVSINDVRGRMTVQLLNEYGEPTLTGIPFIAGKVVFADGSEKEIKFRPEHTYWNESEGTYSDAPIGYSSTYYLMGSWLKGVGCVDTTVTVEGQELKFTCQTR